MSKQRYFTTFDVIEVYAKTCVPSFSQNILEVCAWSCSSCCFQKTIQIPSRKRSRPSPPPGPGPVDPRLPKRPKRAPTPPSAVATNPESLPADHVPADFTPRSGAPHSRMPTGPRGSGDPSRAPISSAHHVDVTTSAGVYNGPPRDPRLFPYADSQRSCRASAGTKNISVQQRSTLSTTAASQPPKSLPLSSNSSGGSCRDSDAHNAAQLHSTAPVRQTTRLDRVLASLSTELVPLGYNMQTARDEISQRSARKRSAMFATDAKRCVSSSSAAQSADPPLSPPERSATCSPIDRPPVTRRPATAHTTERPPSSHSPSMIVRLPTGGTPTERPSEKSSADQSLVVRLPVADSAKERPSAAEKPQTAASRRGAADRAANAKEAPHQSLSAAQTITQKGTTPVDSVPSPVGHTPPEQLRDTLLPHNQSSQVPGTQSGHPVLEGHTACPAAGEGHGEGEGNEVQVKQEPTSMATSMLSLDSSVDAASFIFKQLFGESVDCIRIF